MYQDTITLFNRIDTASGTMWHPVILHNVDLNADKGAMLAQYGDSCKDTAKLHISYTGDPAIIEGLTYYGPKAYRALSSKSGAITFQSGSEFDFFIAGALSFQTDIADDDYADGFYNYANRTYDDCFCITSVAKYSVIPHFEIMAR